MSAYVRARARKHGAVLASALWLLSGGCDGCRKKPEPVATGLEPGEPAKAALAQPAVLEGVVRLAEGAELPGYAREQLEKRILAHTEQAALPAACSPPKTTDRQPVQLTPDGLLTNIVLAATDFARQPERPPMVHEVIIDDCRLSPPIVVAMKGDQLRVRNALEYPFMPTYGEAPVVKTLIRGQTYEVPLDKPGVSPLMCGFTAPCGRTDVVVMLHPVNATTGADGKFKIENFPAGEDVKLSAWHPLFEESSIDVRVEPGEVKRVELVLEPKAAAPEPQPTTTPK